MVVLHQVRSPDNLGAVARLMANFGFEQLVLSEPVTYAFRAAEKLAVGAKDLLGHLIVENRLQDALSHGVYACGTTSRREVRGREIISPREGIARLARQAKRGRVGLVFGGEKRGLSDEELSLCQDVMAIPTSESQPSMNLSHAVAVLLYLCAERTRRSEVRAECQRGASLGMMRDLEKAMSEVWLRAGFLNSQAPTRILREIRRSLLRANLTEREGGLWLSAFRQLRRAMT